MPVCVAVHVRQSRFHVRFHACSHAPARCCSTTEIERLHPRGAFGVRAGMFCRCHSTVDARETSHDHQAQRSERRPAAAASSTASSTRSAIRRPSGSTISAPSHATIYVKAEFFNPAASVKDRLALNIIEEAERSGALKPGPDRGRGDQRQYRHRACHGLRAEGLSAGRDHGRQLLDRAPQADAHAGRQGGADAARPEGLRHVQEGRRTGRGQWLVPGPPVRDQGQRRHPRGDDGARDHQRFRRLAARLFRHRLRHRRHRRRRRPRAAPGAAGDADRAQRARQRAAHRQRPSRRSATPTARRPPAIRPSSRIRSRAGRRISFPTCCRRRSNASSTTR